MRTWVVLAAAVLCLGGCREGDAPVGLGADGVRIFITSDPNGARIIVDGRDTQRLTPDTVTGFQTTHDVQLRLDTLNTTYEYNVRLTVDRSDSTVYELNAPLTVQCVFSSDLSPCYRRLHTYRTAAGLRFATNSLGSLFMYDGQGRGAFWPAASANSYVSAALPVFAAMSGNTAVALGIYDHAYFAGRPVPRSTSTGTRTTLSQSTWVVPPTSAHQRVMTARGIEVREEITTDDAVSGVVLIKLTFRNITNSDGYQLRDAFVPAAGITFSDAFIGMLLDPDIGEPRDDWLSYDPDLDMTFAYDARFAEPAFEGQATVAPALVGLRALRAPAGTSVILNGYVNEGGVSDWMAGTGTEATGFGMLSGRTPYSPDHANARIGHLPTVDGDVRIAVTAGPLTLAPGAEAEMILAVAFAPPAAGAFQTGTLVSPGDPLDKNRALYRIASELRARMQAAAALLTQ